MTIEKSPYEIALERIEEASLSKSISLALPNLGLEFLPPEIKKLKNLSTLYLHNNRLSTLPNELGSLHNLTKLSLSHNHFGIVPPEIFRLFRLATLWLNNNNIISLPEEIGELKHLRSLWLNDNKLKSLPTKIKQLVKLSELWLNNNELESLPSELGELVSLKVLWLSNNRLVNLPPEIGNLRNLRQLYVPRNQLNSVPSKIGELSELEELILGDLSGGNELQELPKEIGQLTNLKKLDVSRNKLQNLPSEIQNLKVLSELYLSMNQFSVIPTEVFTLDRLLVLWLSGNSLKEFPRNLSNLKKLTVLWLSGNQLDSISPTIGDITQLSKLYLHNNRLNKLPAEIRKLNNLSVLDLSRNPRLAIPPEILEIRKNPKLVLEAYFSARFSLNEAKLLFVGQGSVDKTSLVNRFLENNFDLSQAKTDGIIIRHGKIQKETQPSNSLADISLNIWDFGGQEIMHATHQFFLTKRSLYILVLDSRLTQEENRVEYWLKIIQSFGGESPVLIVGNKTDQHPLDIDRTGLQKKYPNIVSILETSAATGTGIEDLKAAITEQVNNLPHVRDLLPETWFTVKTKLEELGRESNFITHDKYLELCAKNEVSDETSQRTLIGFLHDLGVVLHFQDDPRLEALGILNPQWVTNGVYKILNSHTLFQNKGVLTTSMLDEILNLPEYPRGKRLFIVDMMKKFELCYEMPYGYDIESDKIFLVPDLLPKDQPDLKFNGVPAFEYAYPVLPSSVITRFIVRMNQKIDDGLVWRTGVVLKIGENKALVKADIEDRKITIVIDGVEYSRRDALSAIRYELGEIHNSIKGLNPQQRVPVPNAPQAEPLKYEYLLKLERAGQETVLVENGNDLVTVNVCQMLSAIETEAQRRENTPGSVTTNYYIQGDVNASGDFVGRDKSITAGDNSIVVGGNVSDSRISANYKNISSAEIAPELKETMKQLAEAVDAMIQKLPADQATEVAEDFGKLADEAVKSKPNKKWYSVSIEGLIKAAENLDKFGTPVISLSRKVLSLLTGGVIK